MALPSIVLLLAFVGGVMAAAGFALVISGRIPPKTMSASALDCWR
jgi:hypothetical protein